MLKYLHFKQEDMFKKCAFKCADMCSRGALIMKVTEHIEDST